MLTSYIENVLKKESILKFNYKNIYEYSLIRKTFFNFGVQDSADNPNKLVLCCYILKIIIGDCPTIRKSKKSVYNLRIRKGMFVSCFSCLGKRKNFIFLDSFFFNFSAKNYSYLKKISTLSEEKKTFNLLNIQKFIKGVSFFNFIQNFSLPHLNISLESKKIEKFISFLVTR
jgi:ribosomal protein L5